MTTWQFEVNPHGEEQWLNSSNVFHNCLKENIHLSEMPLKFHIVNPTKYTIDRLSEPMTRWQSEVDP